MGVGGEKGIVTRVQSPNIRYFREQIFRPLSQGLLPKFTKQNKDGNVLICSNIQ